MAIKIFDDVVVPGVVPLMDWVFSEKVPAEQPGKYADYVGLGLCLAGYGLAAFGIWDRYTKNIGIASLDWAVNSIRNLVKGAGATAARPTQRLVMRPAARVAGSETVVVPSYRPQEEVVMSVT
jgi:hypothetical protein